MHFLLTNDDGVDAAGLQALSAAAAALGSQTWVAPHRCWSGCSHVVTTDSAFRVTQRSDNCHVVEAAPADCVRVGLRGLVPHAAWVLSGINHGGNLGADIHLSGTVAAVREAALLGIPGIAVSQYRRKELPPPSWERASRWLTPVLQRLTAAAPAKGVFFNVNLPHLPEDAADPPVVFCPVDPGPLEIAFEQTGDVWKYSGNYHRRPQLPGADVAHCFGGSITVSEIRLAGC